MSAKNTRTELDRLLQLRNEHPEKAAELDAQIWVQFSQTYTILVLDMSGFSRLTLRYSIIHFLAMVQRLCAIAVPIFKQYQGKVVKQEADNIFAVFPDVELAIEASIDILKSFAAINTGLPDSQDIHASIGIGYGEVLLVEDKDLYGNEMNLACKLGEDLARSGEILLTEAAFNQLNHSTTKTPPDRTWEKLEFSISGLELVTYKLEFAQPL